jgi:hypothetical protein
MDEKVEAFCAARDYVLSTLAQKIEVFLTGMWDPINKHLIIKETMDIIETELIKLFPNVPVKQLPRCRFRVFEQDMEIEAGVQNYYNHEPELSFLGTSMIGPELFDCYYRGSYDPRFEYMFVSRYGHGPDDYYVGSKTAAAEYYLGQQTPLSIAYGLAIEDGFIG